MNVLSALLDRATPPSVNQFHPLRLLKGHCNSSSSLWCTRIFLPIFHLSHCIYMLFSLFLKQKRTKTKVRIDNEKTLFPHCLFWLPFYSFLLLAAKFFWEVILTHVLNSSSPIFTGIFFICIFLSCPLHNHCSCLCLQWLPTCLPQFSDLLVLNTTASFDIIDPLPSCFRDSHLPGYFLFPQSHLLISPHLPNLLLLVWSQDSVPRLLLFHIQTHFVNFDPMFYFNMPMTPKSILPAKTANYF